MRTERTCSLKGMIQSAPVHRRGMEIQTFPVEGGRLIVEGWLKDERLVPGFHWDGRPRDPGVVHWMCVRFLVGDWPLSILEVEGEMPGIPNEQCPVALESLERLKGVSISTGFGIEVRKRLGGVRGCAHMTTLILSMGPAAVHGYWAERSRSRRPPPESLDDIPGLDQLRNSCILWRDDGPILRSIREFLEKQ